jgi:hypothetical protein
MQSYFSFEKELWKQVDNTQLELCRFERFLDKPVVPHGGTGAPDEHHAQFSNVIHDGQQFVMWYGAMRPPPKDIWHMEDQQNLCIAYSDDGIGWEKPNLKLSGKKWGKSPDNVLPSVSRDVYGCAVIRDGDEYVMAHSHPRGIKVEEGQTTFSIYKSKDGVRWTGSRKSCIDAQHFETNSSMYKFKGQYWVLGQGVSPFYHMPDGREIGRVMFVYHSKDLKRWKLFPKPSFAYDIPKYFPSSSIQNHVGAGVVDRGRIAVGFMGQFWPAGFSEVVGSTFGLVYSYDGGNWTEPFHAEPLIMPDPKSWDRGMLLQGSGIYSRGDRSLYWYTGLDGGNLWSVRGSIGVLKIRRDGFAYLRASGSSPALAQTDLLPLSKDNNQLYLNCTATTAGPIDVSCMDERGKTVANTKVIRSGVMTHAIDLSGIDPKKIALKFKLHGKSKLYSFYLSSKINNLPAWLDKWR